MLNKNTVLIKDGWRLETTKTVVSLIQIYRDPPTTVGVFCFKRLLDPTSVINQCMRIITQEFMFVNYLLVILLDCRGHCVPSQ